MTTKNNTVYATPIAAEAKHNPSCWRRIATLLTLAMTFAWAGAAESVATEIMKESTSDKAYCYRIVNANHSKQIYATTNAGGYGVKLKLRDNTGAAEDFWYFIPGDGGYYIANRATGQYMYYNDKGPNDAMIELSSIRKSLFVLTGTTYNDKAAYMIAPKGVASYFNPFGGSTGSISLYDSETDNNSKWMLRDETKVVRYAAPEITVTGWNVTMTVPAATVYYTTDGTVPTTASTAYAAPFSHEGASPVLARVIAGDGASEIVCAEKTAAPTYSFTGDKTKAVLTAPANTTLYYTTDGTEPTSTSAQVAAGNTGEVALSVANPIKVMAREEGKLGSDVVAIEERELGVAPVGSTDEALKAYRIVHARWHLDGDTRYLYPTAETGTYGRWLKTTAVGEATVESEQYWYLMDAGDGYYYLQNAMTGEYLYRNRVEVNGQDRIEMTYKVRTRFNISPLKYPRNGVMYDVYGICPEDSPNDSFNPADGKKDSCIATYSKGDINSYWFFTDEVSAARYSQPTISLVGRNVVMTVPSGSTVYYTTDGTFPTSASEEYTGEFPHENLVAGDTILAVAVSPAEVVEVPEGSFVVDTNAPTDPGASLAIGRRGIARSGSVTYNSEVAIKVLEATPTPVASVSSDYAEVKVTNGMADATLYYTLDGPEPTYETATTTVGELSLNRAGNEGTTIHAFALQSGYLKSEAMEFTVPASQTISALSEIPDNATGIYVLSGPVTASSHTPIQNFKGIFIGNYHTISGLDAPLFANTDGATIKNVVLKDVAISGGSGNVGAIVGTAMGATRIYNCGVLSGSVGGGENVGSIAGKLEGEGSARVVNCYSFADITGGTTVGGIVGYNSVASTANNLKTLVMNCMYYGDITGGDNKAPIYNGEIISNAGSTGINNYNYYRHESPYSLNHTIDTYNCALAAEERYLTRFEFYRGILNSQRKLSAFYVTGSVEGFEEMGKWVLDKTIAPYPIIKPWGYYPSIINKVPTNRNTPYQGKVLGQLDVIIQGHGTVKLDITDMDTLNYDYNYYKVQLPYYNEYFDNNYTNDRVVTGWKITSVTGGKQGAFTTSGDDRYNFADRNCTEKDLYSKTGIVFAQGGYYNVPEGVTDITIEPYWGNAVYLSDATYDEVYTTDYGGSHFTPAGNTPATYKEQNVYKSLGDALDQLPAATTVYDNAIVLVGNYHTVSEDWSNDQKRPFTIMSVDENRDNEPDYCIFHGHATARVTINPVRFDFLWHPGIGMAHKVNGSGVKMPNQSIFRPLGWFEITETCLARYTEFEYDYANNNRTASPMILNNGIFEQFMSLFNDGDAQNSSRTTYLRLGGNVYMEAFTPGTHTQYSHSTNHPPVTVCGGEYKEFYLSGVRPDAQTVESDALCYTNGGMFSLFASAYMEKINGDVVVKMDHSRVKEFYGGGVNSIPSQISGDIKVTVNNSLIDFYCGGPKFGSMAEGKTVTTEATGTRFGKFYGAGYGGTSFYIANVLNTTPSSTRFNNGSYSGLYTSFEKTGNGYATNYHLEHFSYAGGTATSIVSRFYRHYASLTFAQTNNVVSVLNNCIIDGDFYGGGSQGVVNGDITSTLIDCDIKGSAYGAGFSAAIPVCEVRRDLPTGFSEMNTNSGVFEKVALPAVEKYKWANDIDAVDHTAKLIPTDLDLKGLGTATGKIQIVIGGDSEIAGSVFGGGNMSKVNGQTEIIIDGAGVVIDDSVFGGGNEAQVDGDTHVHIKNGTVNGNVYGAGNKAEVTGTTDVVIGGGE